MSLAHFKNNLSKKSILKRTYFEVKHEKEFTVRPYQEEIRFLVTLPVWCTLHRGNWLIKNSKFLFLKNGVIQKALILYNFLAERCYFDSKNHCFQNISGLFKARQLSIRIYDAIGRRSINPSDKISLDFPIDELSHENSPIKFQDILTRIFHESLKVWQRK